MHFYVESVRHFVILKQKKKHCYYYFKLEKLTRRSNRRKLFISSSLFSISINENGINITWMAFMCTYIQKEYASGTKRETVAIVST